MKIGLIVAIETDSVFACYGQPERLACPAGFELFLVHRSGHEIYILHAGMGEIAAAAGTQYLITNLGAELIVNFGVVGGLTSDMKKQRLCVVDRVVHYRYDCTEFLDLAVGQVDGHASIFLPTTPELVEKSLTLCPELLRATCCSGDRFVGQEREKHRLHEQFEGDVCDMESAAVVLTCEINDVPCLLLKAVSDGLSGGAREFYEELTDAAILALRTADRIIESL